MSTVLETVDAGSLSATGRQLSVPLATISRRVSDLEAYLGTQIFIRASRRPTLTEAGLACVDACRRVLEELAGAERAASGEYAAPRGQLAIPAPIVFVRLYVLPVASTFLSAYADVDVRMVLTDRLVDFTEDQIDLAVRIGALPDSGMIASKVGEIREAVCASPAYFARRPAPRYPPTLRSMTASSSTRRTIRTTGYSGPANRLAQFPSAHG